MKYRIELVEAEEGGFIVSVLDLPGCHSEGDTVEEAMDNAKDAIREYRLAEQDDLEREARADGARGQIRFAEVEVEL